MPEMLLIEITLLPLRWAMVLYFSQPSLDVDYVNVQLLYTLPFVWNWRYLPSLQVTVYKNPPGVIPAWKYEIEIRIPALESLYLDILKLFLQKIDWWKGGNIFTNQMGLFLHDTETTRSVQNILKNAFKKVGINKNISVHSLRHRKSFNCIYFSVLQSWFYR